jgi:hypothetical protein
MKKLVIFIFALALSFSLSGFAQNNSMGNTSSDKKVAKAEKKEAKAAAKGKAIGLTGWVKSEDGKTVFVNDKDKQTWSVSNPDALNGHEGHHVKVKANIDESNHSLTVNSVKMLRKSKQANKS